MADEIKIPDLSQPIETIEPASNTLSAQELVDVSDEIEREEKYGDRDLEAAAIGAASGLSFGLSNKLLKKLGYTEEELREIDDRNKAAAVTGEIAGTLAGLIPTGGTGAIAKGAGLAGRAVRGIEKTGRATEQLTAKALNKIIAETGEKKFAKEVIKKAIPKAAGSSVEGAAFGAGQLVKESELGNAEFNAENLASSLGTGALLGGVAGAGIGASIPLFSPAVKVGKKIKDTASKRISGLTDPEDAALDLIGATTTQKINLKKYNPELVAELPDFLVKKGDLGKFTSTDSLFKNLTKLKDESGEKIPQLLAQIDEAATLNPQILPSRRNAFNNVIAELDEKYIQKFGGKKAFSGQLQKVRDIRDDLISESLEQGPLSAQKLQELRKQADELAKFEKTPGKVTMAEQAARDVRRALRKEIDNLAENAASTDLALQNVAKELKQVNKNYSLISQIEKPLVKKVNKPEKIASLTDLIAGDLAGDFGLDAVIGTVGVKKFLESDFRRRLSVLSYVEKQNQRTQREITKGIKNFFKSSARPAAFATKKVIVDSALSERVQDGKLSNPKDPQQAFRNIRDNISEMITDPQKMEQRLIKGTAALSQVAPETASATQEVMMRALNFLNQKMPKEVYDTAGLSSLRRQRDISDLELSKFSRYLQAVESPLSLLQDLQSGTATREQVEAVRFVYPDIYERIVQETYQYIDDPANKVDYNKKVQLGILLEVPTDSSLRSDALRDLQARFRPESEESTTTGTSGQAGPSRLTVSGTKELEIAQRENSEAQAFAARKRS